MYNAAAEWSDGVIMASEDANEILPTSNVPALEFVGSEYIDAYSNFYDKILLEEEVLVD